jgi:hypothetical protein
VRKILFVLVALIAIPASGADKYINPTTGNDANDGLTPTTAWATFTKLRTHRIANPSTVETVYVDTRLGPVYITDRVNQTVYNGTTGQGLTIKSANVEAADIRLWQLRQGATAVKFDDLYLSGVPTYPNVWVFQGVPSLACIWEYMGGRGDNLKWFDHLINKGITPSATYNNATNLSTLNSNAWSWWQGSDGTQQILLFNPNGTPSGRQFAIPYQPGNASAGNGFTFHYGTLENLCIGGMSGCSSIGATAAGTSIEAANGAQVKKCIAYGGASHACIASVGDATLWEDCILREGPRWTGTGGYTPHVWYSETATQPPVLRRVSCPAGWGVAGQVNGVNFQDGLPLSLATSLSVFMLSHGAGVVAAAAGDVRVTIEDCDVRGMIAVPSIIKNSTIAALSDGNHTVDRCTFLYFVARHTVDTNNITIKDSVIKYNLGTTQSNNHPFCGGTLVLQSCTLIAEDYYSTTGGPFISGENRVLDLTVLDCIVEQTNNNGVNCPLTRDLNHTGTDNINSQRNLFSTLLSNSTVHVFPNGLGTGWSLATAQTNGWETGSTQVTDNTTLKLLPGGRLGRGSIALSRAPARTNAPDRTGAIFPSRTTTGAYETPARPAYRPAVRMGLHLAL